MLLLLFQLGSDRYALEVGRVVEVVPYLALKKLPQAPKGVAGIFIYRGRPLVALDLCEFTLGRPAQERLSTRIIVVNCKDSTGHAYQVGLVAERATDVMRRDVEDFVDPGVKVGATPFLGPVLMDNRGVIQLVYAERLLSKDVCELLSSFNLEMSHAPH